MNSATVVRLKEWTSQLEHLIPTGIFPQSELVQALRRDHDDLRVLLDVLKSDKHISTRKTAYKQFVPLLVSHARAEEAAVYAATKNFKEIRKKTLEGWVEHEACDLMVAKIAGIRNPERWSAAVQVLAEMVEHHLDEEERDLFPEIDRLMSIDKRLAAEAQFLALRSAKAGKKPLGIAKELAS